jgi:DNA mismatch repair protein MutS2
MSKKHGGPEPRPYRPEDWVRIPSMRGVGRIVRLDRRRGRAEVDLGGAVWTLGVEELGEIVPPEQLTDREAIQYQTVGPVQLEIDLHGRRVPAALEALEKFIDSALVHHVSPVKVIHGYGTGKLRAAVREWLDRHPHVRAYHFGEPAQGGLAVTIVVLGGEPPGSA